MYVVALYILKLHVASRPVAFRLENHCPVDGRASADSLRKLLVLLDVVECTVAVEIAPATAADL